MFVVYKLVNGKYLYVKLSLTNNNANYARILVRYGYDIGAGMMFLSYCNLLILNRMGGVMALLAGWRWVSVIVAAKFVFVCAICILYICSFAMLNICAKNVANLDFCDYTTKKTGVKINFLYASDENIGLSLCIYAIFSP